MASPVEYSPNLVLGMQWQTDTVIVGGKVKRRIRAKGHLSNKVTIIGDSIIQMFSDLLITSIQSVPGAYARNIVEMCESGVYVIEGFSAVLVLAGTNDQCKSAILEILVSFRRIVHHIRIINPLTRIAICGVLPRPVDFGSPSKMEKLETLNDAIQADCKQMNVCYVKTEKGIKDKGTISEIYRNDGIHLTDKGVGFLANYLEGVIGSLLGDPSQWDAINKRIIPRI
jgi:hypothetical protein